MQHPDFEQFLINEHARKYVGNPEDREQDFKDWTDSLLANEIIELGNRYAFVACYDVIGEILKGKSYDIRSSVSQREHNGAVGGDQKSENAV